MSSTHSPKPRIAIVGAGIGGLTLAAALTNLDVLDSIQVDIYESTAKLTEVGAGITLWPRGWEILQTIGLDAPLSEKLPPDTELPDNKVPRYGFVVRKSDQKEGSLITDVKIPGGSLSLHRADVQDVLLKHISPLIKIHLSHRLQTYRQTEQGVEIEFQNGTTAYCDLLVGADGINSAVRRTLLAEGKNWSEEEKILNAKPVWTGEHVYRNLIDSELIKRESPNHSALKGQMLYAGKNKHVVGYPVSQEKYVNTVVFVTHREKEGTFVDGPTMTENTSDDFKSHFADWEDEVTVLLKNMSKPSRWAVQTVRPLDTYVSGRVLLLGDSAHAMQPHLGNGAGQAMEDAYILSNIVAKAVVSGKIFDAPKLAEIYNAIRRPFGNFVAAASRNQSLLYELASPEFEDVKEGDTISKERLEELGKEINKVWDWTWASASGDAERALSML